MIEGGGGEEQNNAQLHECRWIPGTSVMSEESAGQADG